MFDYRMARPNENKMLNYLEDTCSDWEEIAKSIMGWLSDDDVRRWAENNGYDIFEEEEEEEKEFEIVVHFEGAINYTIKACDEDEAKDIAESKFQEESAKTICENIADSEVCDCWEK